MWVVNATQHVSPQLSHAEISTKFCKTLYRNANIYTKRSFTCSSIIIKTFHSRYVQDFFHFQNVETAHFQAKELT